MEVISPGGSESRLSWPSRTAALAGALAILLGLTVLIGWAIHALILIQVAPNLAPMQRNTAFGFVLIGLALLGMALGRPKLTWIGSAPVAALAVASLLETSDPGRMAPVTAVCFLILAAGFTWAQTIPFGGRSPVLGVAGLLAGAVGAACCISVLWGSGDAFALGHLPRV